MKFLVIRKADQNTESGRLPGREMLEAMGKYKDELRKAGVLLSGEALLSSAHGSRVTYSNGSVRVTDGPFAETKELIAGFLILEVNSREEAIAWAQRCPTLTGEGVVEMEVRQVIDVADFPPDLMPVLCGLPWSSVANDARTRLEDLRA
jgi:hypothetical protein